MVLTANQLAGKGIVHGGVPAGARSTTYDATVGSIIIRGVAVTENHYVMRPREIIWVVSAETFNLGDSTTGLATLMTRWTHRGVLALNVGIIDPGWDGPVAAAVVNFGSTDFLVEKGNPFFRILFHDHQPIPAGQLTSKKRSPDEYLDLVTGYSRSFSTTFLDMDDLSRTVADKVLHMPQWGFILSLGAIVLGLLSITIPVGFQIWADGSGQRAKITALEARMDSISVEKTKSGFIDPARCKLGKVGNETRLDCPVP